VRDAIHAHADSVYFPSLKSSDDMRSCVVDRWNGVRVGFEFGYRTDGMA